MCTRKVLNTNIKAKRAEGQVLALDMRAWDWTPARHNGSTIVSSTGDVTNTSCEYTSVRRKQMVTMTI